MRFYCLSVRLAALAIAVCSAGGVASAETSDYEVRRFDDGPGWLVFDEGIDVALQVLKPNNPRCHELGEIILLFERPNQLGDANLIETAALAGMERYSELCRAFGGTPSNQRRVSGMIVGAGEADARGRVMGDLKVLDGMVTSLTGSPDFRIRRIATISEGDATGQSTAAAHDARPADSNRGAEIAEIRSTYGAALAESMAEAEPIGALTGVTGGTRASLTGAWSGSAADCATERLILFERSGTGTVQWWRAPSDDVGLLPWRSGGWQFRDGTLIMTFDQRVEYDDFLGRLRDGPIDESVQFDLKKIDRSEFRLAATGGGFSPEALFLGGAEKLFVRCRD